MDHGTGTNELSTVMLFLAEIMLSWYLSGKFALYVARRRPQDSLMLEILDYTDSHRWVDNAILIGGLLLGTLALIQ